MNYRIMTESDIDTVIPLYMEYYNTNGDCWTQETAHRRIWQVLGSPDSYCLIAEQQGAILGFAIGRFETYSDLTAYDLIEIVIAAEQQGKGYGTAFMQELEVRVKAKGAAMVQLQAVHDEMHDHFYKKLGYYTAENLVLKAKFLEEAL